MVVKSACCDEGGGGGLAGGDHFVARFLIGNALRGAPAAPQAGYFRWLQDPGNGTAIDQALTEMAALGFACDLCIQEGTYTRQVDLKRFVVPANCRVWGTGGVNIITNNADFCAWELGSGATLERMTLTVGQVGAAGVALVEVPAGGTSLTLIDRVVMATGTFAAVSASVAGGAYEFAGCSFISKAATRGLVVEGLGGTAAQFDAHDCLFDGVSAAVRFGFTANVRDSRVINNRFSLGAGVVPIQAGANSDGCLALGNVSRGSGSTLPTDVGTNNSIAPGVANYWGP